MHQQLLRTLSKAAAQAPGVIRTNTTAYTAAAVTATLSTRPLACNLRCLLVHRSYSSSSRVVERLYSPSKRILFSTSTDSQETSGSSADSSKPDSPFPPLTSDIVDSYWQDVMKYSAASALPPSIASGELDLLDHPDAKHALIQPSDDEGSIRKLLETAVKLGREAGDVYPRIYARRFMDFYNGLDLTGKTNFLRILAHDFGVNHEEVASLASTYVDKQRRGERPLFRAEEQLREVLSPKYSHFFSTINQLPGGMHFLVQLRADVLRILSKPDLAHDSHIRSLDGFLKSLLSSWFGVGFLDLARISWQTTPASVLECIIKYEAVHSIPSYEALKQRLGQGRLCYSFFHRGMPGVPLTFVQVALLKEIEWDVHKILNDPLPNADPKHFKVALFYSISSSQRGLAGVDLGNFLIKRVVQEVQKLHPEVDTFCTLSPIPGFRNWLETHMHLVQECGELISKLLLDHEVQALRREAHRVDMTKENCAVDILEKLLEKKDWHKDAGISQFLKPLMIRLCSQYLLLEKKRKFALDPVANFHIRNGACVHRLNWLGDVSDKGMKQSYGIMVNYVYVLPLIETNNQDYLLDGTIRIIEPLSSTTAWAYYQSQQQQQQQQSNNNGTDQTGHGRVGSVLKLADMKQTAPVTSSRL